MIWPKAEDLADSGDRFIVERMGQKMPSGEWPADEAFIWWDDRGRPLGVCWPHQPLPEE